MRSPAIALRLRRFRRRFGITAPQVVVRGYFPWRWLAFSSLVSFFLAGWALWFLVERNDLGARGGLEELRRQLQIQREELLLLRSTVGTGRNEASIERATQQQLLGRIRGLEAENAALKEDMLLYERLIPVGVDGASVRLDGFRVLREEGGRYRYKLLVAFQPDRQVSEFRGRLQLVVNFSLLGRTAQLVLPKKGDSISDFQLELKHFLRREGRFDLPEGAILNSVEARVLQGDAIKSKRLAQL